MAASPGRRGYSYRFLFIPGTIGVDHVARAERGRALDRIVDGLVRHVRRRSRRRSPTSGAGAATPPIDRAAAHVLRARGRTTMIVDFSPFGYDERQFCSPGFDLPGRVA